MDEQSHTNNKHSYITPAKTSKHVPAGLIFIVIVVGWGVLSLLFNLFQVPISQLGPFVVTGTAAVVFNVLLMLPSVAIIIGIFLRKTWTRMLGVGWYSFSIFVSVVNLLFFFGNKSMFNTTYEEYLLPEVYVLITEKAVTASLTTGCAIAVAFGSFVIYYFNKKREYFNS